MATVTIEVTAEDIAEGERGHCERCPIALAMRRVLPGVHPEVQPGFVALVPGMELHDAGIDEAEIALPDEARSFVASYDLMGYPVHPFKFTLEVPDEFASASAVLEG